MFLDTSFLDIFGYLFFGYFLWILDTFWILLILDTDLFLDFLDTGDFWIFLDTILQNCDESARIQNI